MRTNIYAAIVDAKTLACRYHTSDSLCGVKCRLEYKHFEKKMVEGKGIVMEGWTYPIITSPSNFKSLADIKRLHDAIRNGDCKAVKLSQQEWNSRVASNAMRMGMGEDVYSEAVHSKRSTGKRKAIEMCDGEGEGNDDDDAE